MPRWWNGFVRFVLGSPQRFSPVHSLPARLGLFVFTATLLTSLLVTGISVYSIDSFLRAKIEQKFPEILERTGEVVESWYDQRLLELEVFAQSETLTQHVAKIGPVSKGERSARARRDVAQYLSYVHDHFSYFSALFVLGTDGEQLLSVGPEIELPDEVIREMASSEEARFSRVVRAGGDVVQLASAPVDDGGSKRLGSLLAVIHLETVGAMLRVPDLGETGRVLLLDADGMYVRARSGVLESGVVSAPNPALSAEGLVLDYDDERGDRVVGCAKRLPRSGWALVVEERYSEAFAPVSAGLRNVLSINLAIVLLFSFVAFRVATSIAEPIDALSDAARRISEGEKDVVIPQTSAQDEVGILTRTITDMTTRLANNAAALESSQAETEKAIEGMRDQNQELYRVNEILSQLSVTDGLTKLHNHRYFQEHLVKEARRSDRTKEPLALVLIDIDRFKRWNDRLGHAGGDEILRRIAEVMGGLIRETDMLARYGGEEFALVLPKTTLEGALALAEKIRAVVAETQFLIDPPSEHEAVTVSIGVGGYNGDRIAFFNEVDAALYRAKAAGRDCVMTADSDEGSRSESA